MTRRRSHFRSARISGPSTSSSTMPARVPRAALRSPTMPDDSLASRDLADGLSGGAAPSASARPPLPPTLILASGSVQRSEEHTSELQSLMRISYAVFCLKKKKKQKSIETNAIVNKEVKNNKTIKNKDENEYH